MNCILHVVYHTTRIMHEHWMHLRRTVQQSRIEALRMIIHWLLVLKCLWSHQQECGVLYEMN